MQEIIKYGEYLLHLVIHGDRYPVFHSTVSLISIRDRKILVDAGYPTDQSLLVDALASANINPESITDLVLTHFHIDHIGNVRLFNNAHIYMGKEDFNTLEDIYLSLDKEQKLIEITKKISGIDDLRKIRALKNIYTNNHSIVEYLINSNNRITLLDRDDIELDQRVSIRKSPGHSDGHVVVCCNFDKKICIAGDAMPLASMVNSDDFRKDKLINQNDYQFIQTKNLILDWADLILPGHDRPIMV